MLGTCRPGHWWPATSFKLLKGSAFVKFDALNFKDIPLEDNFIWGRARQASNRYPINRHSTSGTLDEDFEVFSQLLPDDSVNCT